MHKFIIIMSADEPCVVIPHQHGSRREHSAYKHTKLCLFSRRKAICVDRLQDVGSCKVQGAWNNRRYHHQAYWFNLLLNCVCVGVLFGNFLMNSNTKLSWENMIFQLLGLLWWSFDLIAPDWDPSPPSFLSPLFLALLSLHLSSLNCLPAASHDDC